MRILLATSLGMACALQAQQADWDLNPNRPTFASPARTTRNGQLELEWGGQDSQPRGGGRNLGTPALLRFGAAPDVEFRVSTPGYLDLSAPGSGRVSGPGDLTLGMQGCFWRNGPFGMDEAVQVNHTFPTASAAKGLGAGVASDGLVLLSSRDLGAFHLDMNVLETWLGRPESEGGGRVSQPAATVSLSRTLTDSWSLTGEVYALGGTELGPRVVSNLWAVGWKASPRMILDAGVDVGLTQGAPRITCFLGLTVGLARFHGA